MSASLQTLLLLTLSNVFMTFAWYAHLKDMNDQPWVIAVFASWGIALFEYGLQVPANRIGFTVMSLPQLKILQEVIALGVRAVRRALHEGGAEMGFPVGGAMPGGRGVLHVPQQLMLWRAT